jgi:predicted dinucleotide-binding enzyme
MAKLYADEDFSLLVVEAMGRLGHDVQTVPEAGQGNRGVTDVEVLTLAVSQGRAVLAFNRRHFIRLHRQVQPHHGILVCTRDDNASALAQRIDQALRSNPTLDDQLIRINRPQVP